MSDEKNGIKNGGANNEDMAPQEDGTKVPLTADGVEQPVDVTEVKFSSNDASGDAKIDMPGTAPAFSGLTKDELMEYANDPFWKRLRWFLFLLFWAAWLAMLVSAIVIIIMAPRCSPPLHWMQDSSIMEYNQDKMPDVNIVTADNSTDDVPFYVRDFVATAVELNMTAVYIPGIISDQEPSKPSDTYTDIDALLKGAKDGYLDVITDLVKSSGSDGSTLDFSNEEDRTKLQAALETWIAKGVKGFFMNEEDKTGIKEFLNQGIAESEGLVVTDVKDMADVLSTFTVDKYREFLKANAQGNEATWNWFKYNPTAAMKSGLSEDLVNLVTLSLYAAPGTPVLEGLDSQAPIRNETEILKYVTPLRKQNALKFSNTSWTNTTQSTQNVIAFTRYLSGTTHPGYAVAVNMDDTNSASVNFALNEAVPDMGVLSVEWPVSGNNVVETEVSLKNVFLEPLSGKIVRFAPN